MTARPVFFQSSLADESQPRYAALHSSQCRNISLPETKKSRTELCRILTAGIFVASLVAQDCFPASLNWTEITPASPVSNGQPAWVTDFFVNPINSSNLYTGTLNDGLFVSTDGGGSWNQRLGFQGATSPSPVKIAPFPSNPDRMYANIFVNFSNTIYSSNDGGQTWIPPGTGLPTLSGNPQQFSSVAVNPITPSTAYAASQYTDGSAPASVYKTTDGGASWSQIGTLNYEYVPNFTVDPNFPDTIYVAAGILWKSTDGGSSWALLNPDILNLGIRVKDIKVDPSNSNTIYAATNGWVYRSTDGGATWSASNSPDGQQSSAVAVDAIHPGTVFAAGGNILYVSHDGGATWTSVGSDPLGLEIHQLTLDGQSQNIFARNMFGHLYRATLDIDGTPPMINPTVLGPTGNNGWYRGDVSIAWTVTDPESGVVSSVGCSPVTMAAETTGTTFSCTATNGAGLTNTVSVLIKIDKTAPTMAGMPATHCSIWPPNHKLVQIAAITATDTGAGLAPGTLSVSVTSNETVRPGDIVITNGVVQVVADRLGNGNGRVYTVAAWALDLAGNTAAATGTCTVPHDQGK